MTSPFRLALAQINPTVGDLVGNAAQVLAHARKAAALKPDLLIFPELSLTGYPPEDLLLQPRFIADAERALAALARELPRELTVVIGAVQRSKRGVHNAAVAVQGGRIRASYHKQLLPNYGVFDEKRYFAPGDKPMLLDLGGRSIGVTICEDIWVGKGPAWVEARKGASLIVNISASPYHAGKLKERQALLRARAKECRAFMAYCNLVGGQDELVFDGASMVTDPKGRLLAMAPQFEEAILTVDLDLPVSKKKVKSLLLPLSRHPGEGLGPGHQAVLDSGFRRNDGVLNAPAKTAPLPKLEEIYTALVVGTRDYLRKNGFRQAVIGLSGGIDSSLVACIAADALGKENVIGVTLPSRFNVAETRADAEVLARNLGIAFHTLPIEPIVEKFLEVLAPLFAGKPRDTTEENLQARVRGVLLMALSNKFNWLVLTTGNKSEVSVGYSTLYGDAAGGFAVIKDIPKNLVYDLSRWRNEKAGKTITPQSVFDRPPTAELRPNQTDQDSLPPYDLLDKIIRLYVENNRGLSEIMKSGADEATAKRILRLIDVSEYKRRQSPPGVKITPRAFGRDRRMPITNRYRQEAPPKK